jgi:hypothetical protein
MYFAILSFKNTMTKDSIKIHLQCKVWHCDVQFCRAEDTLGSLITLRRLGIVSDHF